jgi:hypothetical protein
VTLLPPRLNRLTTGCVPEPQLRDVLLRRPILIWLVFLAAVTAMAIVAKALAPSLLSGPAGVGPLQVALQSVMLLMVLPFALRVGARRLGLRPVGRRQLMTLLFPALTVAYGFVPGFRLVTVETLVWAVLSVALAGLVEEVAFRGVLLDSLRSRGLWPAVAISSALFGLMHVSNVFLGSPWYSVLLQITFAAMAGTGYAAMRLRTGSIWPPIVLHAIFDLTFRVAAVEPGSLFVHSIHMLHGVGWLLFALITLRPSTTRTLPRLHG